MTPAAARTAGCLLALAIPAVALWFAADDVRPGLGLVAPPFGWPRLAAAHLVCGLPLALALAHGIARAMPGRPSLWAVALGVGTAAITVAAGPQVEAWLAANQAG